MGKTKFENSLVGMRRGGGGKISQLPVGWEVGGGGLPRRIPIFNPVALI